MKTSFLRFALLLVVLTLGVLVNARAADDLGAVKARMTERLSKLDAFKKSGVIGENNRGLVELRGGGPEAGDVVAAENHDRETVYAAIAQQTGAKSESVGHARARKIAIESPVGAWLQKDNGDWYQKQG